ncbi:MAG: hypothetical protein CMK59_03075 [Proteobacteria bacterium]|nr:hypothetical protein [Pseudomonadota bacterium]
MNTKEQDSSAPFLSPWWGFLAIFSIGFPLFFLLRAPSVVLDHFGTIPRFTLTNQEGLNKTSEDYLGKTLIVNFIYTRCQDVCPGLTAKMSSFHKKNNQKDTQYISITVDPKYDQPKILYDYAESFSANHKKWDFLTAEQDQILFVVRGFQQAYERYSTPSENDTPPRILHSEKFILVDPQGSIRGFFETTPEGLSELKTALYSL